jgi:hypothetical protein
MTTTATSDLSAGPGNFSNFDAAAGVGATGPAVTFGFNISSTGGLGSNGYPGSVSNSQVYSEGSPGFTGTPEPPPDNGNESSTQIFLSTLPLGDAPEGQPAQNSPVTYNGTAWANAGSVKWE